MAPSMPRRIITFRLATGIDIALRSSIGMASPMLMSVMIAVLRLCLGWWRLLVLIRGRDIARRRWGRRHQTLVVGHHPMREARRNKSSLSKLLLLMSNNLLLLGLQYFNLLL